MSLTGNVNEHEILISSYLLKRNKSKNWQRKWWVLRRNQLSYYKDSKEYKASKVIPIANILSFSKIPDHHSNHFIIVTNERIYHLRALSLEDFQNWMQILDMISKLNEYEEDELVGSDNFFKPRKIKDNLVIKNAETDEAQEDITTGNVTDGDQSIAEIGHDMQQLNFSGTDDNFTSGLSDGGNSSSLAHPNQSALSLQHHFPPVIPEELEIQPVEEQQAQEQNPETFQHKDRSDTYNSLASDSPEHIIEKGYLLRLKKRYNQWKKYYITLTNRYMIFYKNFKDFESEKIYKKIDLNDLIDVVELDPLSKSKLYCMLIITPMKRIRFCAENEEQLIKWLVLLKAIINTRKNNSNSSTKVVS